MELVLMVIGAVYLMVSFGGALHTFRAAGRGDGPLLPLLYEELGRVGALVWVLALPGLLVAGLLEPLTVMPLLSVLTALAWAQYLRGREERTSRDGEE